MHTTIAFGLLLNASAWALPQAGRQWAQCGGKGYTGPSTCPAGYYCSVSNEWYSQCIPEPGSSTIVSKTSTATPTTIASSTRLPTTSGPKTTSSSAATPKPTTTYSKPTTNSSKPTTASSKTTTLAATPSSSSATFQYLGRVNPTTNELTWSGTGITFSFTGTTFSIPVNLTTGSNSAILTIDTNPPIIISNVSGTSITAPSTLPETSHTITLRKKSEAQYGSIFIRPPTVSGSFTATSLPAKRIEIIGDSISVGYGEDGTYPCTNTAALEDAENSYGALTAQALGYDYSIIAWSGKGLVRNIATGSVDTSPLMPELWTRYGANDADNTYPFTTPVDIVVINLGTNDFSYLKSRQPLNASEYTAGLVSFSQNIQAKYGPGVGIFISSSPMLSDSYPTAADAQHTTQSNAIKAAVAQIGSHAHFVDLPTQDGSSLGCDYHPSLSTHQQMASILEAAIRDVVSS